MQQAAQHQLRLPRTGAARDLSDPLHVDAATHHTVEHLTTERELPSVADVVVQSLRGDGEGRAASGHFPRSPSAATRAQLAHVSRWGVFHVPGARRADVNLIFRRYLFILTRWQRPVAAPTPMVEPIRPYDPDEGTFCAIVQGLLLGCGG